MSLANTLRTTRAQLAATIASIDALLAECPDIDPLERIPVSNNPRCEWITQHAVARWKERTGSKKSDIGVANRLSEAVAFGHEWELKPKFKLIEMLAHGHHSQFYMHGGMIFVVENKTLVTVHTGKADRWQPLTPTE